ncbi:class I lanthipeptide [uncultured Lacinutrix sp.]|nr:class I lanthipeptide [uncultured Lacinutrix sp.]
MKTKLKTNKLALNKLKISTLNSVETSKIKGGTISVSRTSRKNKEY